MNKTIQIKEENVLNAYKNADKKQKELLEAMFGKETFAPTDIRERVKTFEDAVNLLGEEHPYVKSYNGYAQNIHDSDKNDADIIAYLKLRIIVAALNEGWKPKFDGKEWRYEVYFVLYTQEEYNNMTPEQQDKIHLKQVPAFVGSACDGSFCGVSALLPNTDASRAHPDFGGCLALRTNELAIYCGTQWIDLWADFFIA